MASPGGVEVGRVSIRVVPDTSHLGEEIKRDVDKAQAKQKSDPVKVPVKASTDAMNTQIRADVAKISKSVQLDIPATADGERLRRDIAAQVALIEGLTKIEIPVDLADAAALRNKMAVELDLLKSMAAKANPTVDVHTEVDALSLAKTKAELSAATDASHGFSSGLSGIATAAIVLGPALIPLIGVLGGITAALAAPAVLATGGLTLFGFITGAAIKQTETQNKKLLQLKAAVDSAKQSLANASASASTSAANSLSSAQASAAASLKSAQNALANAKTTAQVSSAAQRIQAAHASLSARTSAIQASQSATVAAAQRKVAEATAAYQAALKGMTPAQLTFIRAQNQLKDAFHNLLGAVGSSVLGPVTKALQILTTIMPDIEPILKSFAKVFDGWLNSAGDAAKSRGFSDLIHLVASNGSSAFKTFGEILGNTLTAFSRLAFGLAPLGNSLLSSLGNAAKGFADFSKSAKAKTEVKAFGDYLKTNGPKIGAALGDIAGAVGRLIRAFAPIGLVVIGAIDGLARAINRIPVSDLTTLAVAVTVLVGGLKAISTFAGVVSAIVAAPEVAVAAVAVGALAFGFIALYRNSKPLRNVIGDLGDYFKTKFLPQIKSAAHDLLPALKKAFHDISKTIHENKPFLETMGKLLIAITSDTVIAGLKYVAFYIRAVGKAFEFGVPLVKFFVNAQLTGLRVLVGGFGIFLKAVLFVFGSIVDASAKAFGWMPKIGSKINDAQKAFHSFADGVTGNLDAAGRKLAEFQRSINTTPPKPFKITVNDLQAVKTLEALQAFRLKDKKFTVSMIERVVGPGGGIGMPGRNSAGELVQHRVSPPDLSTPTTNPRQTTGTSPLVVIQNATLNDGNAVLRHAAKAYRAKGGGGITLPPPQPVGAFS